MRVVSVVLAALVAFSLPIVSTGAEEPQEVSVTGEPVDIQCYLGGRSGEGHASCAKSCAESGLPIGFVTVNDEGKEQLYLVMGGKHKSAKDYMAEHMGQEVTATGDVQRFMDDYEADPSASREDVARVLFSWQMEIYSANAGGDLYPRGGYDSLSDDVQEGWLIAADEQLKKAKEKANV